MDLWQEKIYSAFCLWSFIGLSSDEPHRVTVDASCTCAYVGLGALEYRRKKRTESGWHVGNGLVCFLDIIECGA